MKRKKVSAYEAIKAEIRGIKTVNSTAPGTPLSYFLYGIAKAIMPYAGVYFSAQIIGELSGERSPELLWFWVITALVATAIIAILNAALLRYRNYKDDMYWINQSQTYAEKYLTMDFTALDDPHTHELRSKIDQNAHSGGYGLYSASWFLEDIGSGITSVLCAAILTTPLFFLSVPNPSGFLAVLNHPLCGVAVIALLIVAVIFGAMCSRNAQSLFAAGVEDNSFINRLLHFFAHTAIEQRKRALDIRIYNQQTIFKEYSSVTNEKGVGGIFGSRKKIAAISNWNALSAIISAVFIGAIYLFVCIKAWAGAFGAGQIVQYVGAITALYSGVLALFGVLGGMKNNTGFLQTTFEFLDIPNKMYQGSLPVEKRKDKGHEIELRNVSFKYPKTDIWALRNVSMKFKAGQRLAVVGENGSGKTTFIKLLCRLYDPDEGEILLDGVNIKEYRYEDYIKMYSVAFQDFQMISQPVGNNISGAGSYDRAKAEQALKDIGVQDRVNRMKQGLDTYLYRDYSEDGVEISGGEAQKIAIARAIYKDAPFIILDEPTAALDPIAEAEIYEHFGAIAGNRTTICISHRLSSCKFCDEILVFDKGTIIQAGTHDALVADDHGKYAALWNAQAQYYVDNKSS